ncbi:MAG: response regulator [Lachnospiraceae bacterium]|nr:response regulator [Lachnospiraceae bacterium]
MKNTNETNYFDNCRPTQRGSIFDSLDELKMADTKVLIIEDNEIHRSNLSKLLSEYGVISDIAKNADEAIAYFTTNDYDMIMIDYLMTPDQSGIETIKQIRDIKPKGSQQLIIGMTSAVTQSVSNQFHSTDVDIILAKPIKRAHIATLLKREFPDKVL